MAESDWNNFVSVALENRNLTYSILIKLVWVLSIKPSSKTLQISLIFSIHLIRFKKISKFIFLVLIEFIQYWKYGQKRTNNASPKSLLCRVKTSGIYSNNLYCKDHKKKRCQSLISVKTRSLWYPECFFKFVRNHILFQLFSKIIYNMNEIIALLANFWRYIIKVELISFNFVWEEAMQRCSEN